MLWNIHPLSAPVGRRATTTTRYAAPQHTRIFKSVLTVCTKADRAAAAERARNPRHAVVVPAAEVEEFRESSDTVYIRESLYIERESQKGMVIGSGGRTIRALGASARTDIEALLNRRAYLDLWVKVLPKWRTSPHVLHQLGFAVPAGRSR